MSYWVIKYETSCMNLSDFRPSVDVPQWYWGRERAFRFPDLATARAFWRETKVRHPGCSLGKVRFVRIVSSKERRAERAALRESLAVVTACPACPICSAQAKTVLAESNKLHTDTSSLSGGGE